MMKLVWSLLVAAAVCGSQAERIVGGEATSIENYPSIVQVEIRTWFIWGQSCAASILTNLWVVSAAHCFDGIFFSVDDRRIRAGATIRVTGGTLINVQSRINHPSYGSSGLDGDISVVRLTSPLAYSQRIQPIAIPNQNFELPDHLPVIHAGWGATSQGGLSSIVLRDVTIYTINRQLCAERYAGRGIVTDNMICAGILDQGGKDACQGDSGGPMYYTNDYLVGIVSWGQGCAQANFPGVSTRVSSYTDWIVANAV